MNKKIIFLTLLGLIVLAPIVAHAAAADSTLCKTIVLIKDIVVNVGGTIAIIGWVIAGILYLTAAGNPGKIQIAKQALIAAVIGTILVVIALAAPALIQNALGPVVGAVNAC